MFVDTGMVAILVAVLLSLLGLAVGWGTLRERVRNLGREIGLDRQANTDDHKQILASIESIRRSLNGKGNK